MSPYKRSTILNSKILSTIVTTITMLLVSLFVSSLSGIIVLGDSAQNIITIFNANKIVTISSNSYIYFFGILCNKKYRRGGPKMAEE